MKTEWVYRSGQADQWEAFMHLLFEGDPPAKYRVSRHGEAPAD